VGGKVNEATTSLPDRIEAWFSAQHPGNDWAAQMLGSFLLNS
jgi:hypothetical protein